MAPQRPPGKEPELGDLIFEKKRAPASTGARFSRILGAPKWLQNRPKMAPESLPGGLRDPDRAGSPTWGPYFRKKAPPLETFVVFSSENKPGYHGTGSARGERASNIASKARAARAARAREGAPQDHKEGQGESDESRPRIETASPYERFSPSSPAPRARRAV